jgi:hypothetical protein
VASFFISHSARDKTVAEDLRDRLKARGFESLFLDFDPDHGTPAGREWERELYAQLRACDAVVFLGSPDSASSRWCFAGLALTLGREADLPAPDRR